MTSLKKSTIVLDERINCSSEHTPVMHVGPSQVQYSSTVAAGSTFPSNIMFNSIAVPTNTIVSRDMKVSYTLEIAFPSNQANESCPDYVLPGTFFKQGLEPNTWLRSLPLSQCTSSLQMTLNNQVLTQDLRNVVGPVSRCFDREFMRKAGTLAPIAIDNACVLAPSLSQITGSFQFVAASFPANTLITMTLDNGMQATFTTGAAIALAGMKVPITISQLPGLSAWYVSDGVFVQNKPYAVVCDIPTVVDQPTSSYLASKDGDSRGCFKAVYFAQNQQLAGFPVLANGYTIYRYIVTEPLIISPASLEDDKPGLCNVNTLSIQYQFSNLQTMVSTSAFNKPIDLTSFFVNIVQPSPVLSLKYFSVDSDVMTIPKSYIVPYESTQFFVNQTTSMDLSADAVQYQQIYSPQTYALNSLPSLIYIYCRVAQAVVDQPITANSRGKFASVFMGIGYQNEMLNPFQCTLNNRSGLLSGMNLIDLFEMSVRNGYQYSYATWKRSPVIIINPTTDLGVSVAMGETFVGEAGKIMFSFQMTINSGNYWEVAETQAKRQLFGVPSGLTPVEACLLTVLGGGEITISQSLAMANDGSLTEAEVRATLKAPSHAIVSTSDIDLGAGLFAHTPRHIAGTARKH